MAREQEVLAVLSKLVVATAKEIALVMAALGFWAAGVSALNNSMKALKNLVALRQVEVISRGVYRYPGSKGTGGEHYLKGSNDLARILAVYPESTIYREVTIPGLNLKPDALVMLRKEGHGALIIYECLVTEQESHYAEKELIYREYPGMLAFLSSVFGVNVPAFSVISSNDVNSLVEG